eukprot:gene7670-5379_t
MRNFLLPQNPQHTRFCSHIDEYLQTFHCEWCVADHGHVIVAQAKAALKILTLENPDKIPLSPYQPHNVIIIWLDAHPAITLPGDAYAGYHAMAVTATLGFGDEKISMLPSKFQPSHILEIAIRNWKR